MIGLTQAGYSGKSCSINTANDYEYMCHKMGIELDDMGPVACVQEDMKPGFADLLIEGDDWMVSCGDTD